MNRKLTVAAFATTLAVAPVALAQSSWSDPNTGGTAISRDAPRSDSGLYVDDRASSGTYSGAPAGNDWNTESRGRGAIDPMASYGSTGTSVSGDAANRNPGQFVDDRAAAGTYSGAPSSQSWNTDDRARSGMTTAPGYPGTAGSGVGTGMAQDGRVLVDLGRIPDIQQRQGPGQNRLELMQTTLLNHLVSFGIEEVRGFHKQGEMYVADISHRGQWMTVQLDPNTGIIRAVR
ncbi:hypothetical protein [Azospirillum sp. A39]|uniref:hypothetical protein n=1 Tax=Azospirillum sp. A39 TaxID=3462279 RepID=UPI00404554CD